MSSSASRNATFLGPKPTKACVNCRRQKMKCEVERDQVICKRCRFAQIPCIFKPRANAAAVIHEQAQPVLPAVNASSPAQPKLDPQAVLSRLETIEALLGISSTPGPVVEDDVSLRPTGDDSAFNGVFAAAMHLRMTTRPPQDSKIWSRDTIKQLWLSFHKNMPGLHFLSKKKTSSTPTPLLLAAILYVSALHHQSKEFANLAPGYFIATCNAISELAVPVQAASRASNGPNAETSNLNDEQRSFQNVLGLILAGLISEAFIETAGLWITMGYRLTLDHCPVHIDERSHEWRGLFSGLQIIDLEHASLHMSCPIVPKEAPLPSLRQLQTASNDPFYSLTQMMHAGLSHFTGRGLPTIWSFISNQDSTPRTPAVFTATDSKIIREWARHLDDWLVQWSQPNDPDHDTQMIFRQYSLHRLFVLSIYHPARGFDLFANNFASIERAELLISARATLKLQSEDKGIWSNWDLVMITWAALLVLQGIEGGVGEPDDFNLIQTHLNALLTTHAPAPSLRHTLSTRLESSLQNMHTPRSAPEFDLLPDPEWAIFDASSFQQFQGMGFEGGNAGAGVGGGVGGSNLGGGGRNLRGGESAAGYGDMEGQWISGNGNANGEYTDAWQNTMVRIFRGGNGVGGAGDLGMDDMT